MTSHAAVGLAFIEGAFLKSAFKEKLRSGATLLGTILTLDSPEVAEMLSHVGFDWFWIDMEHSPLSVLGVQRILQAIADRAATIVRVPWNDPVWIKRVLDLGCDGVLIPQIKSAEDATRAVDACRFPPIGSRSVGIGRANDYGMDLQRYLETANTETAVILQVENAEAIQNIEEILKVSGYDAILAGPYDLSGSYGLLGQVNHPTVGAAIQKLNSACSRAKKPIGMFTADPSRVEGLIDAGFGLVALGTDGLFLCQAARKALQDLKR
jgi:2-dehydro-3-deoxyglucarate aldolase/4-hydroxy-2-oxoheptanedioate aldolase